MFRTFVFVFTGILTLCVTRIRADVLLSCGFGTDEGYSTGNDTLVGSKGWLGTTSAGIARSGIDAEETHGVLGIGNAGWLGGNTTQVVWAGTSVNVRHPLVTSSPYSYAPVATDHEVVLISALVGVKDSSTDVVPVRRDRFELFIMNGAATVNGSGDVLGAVQFDNTTLVEGIPARTVRRTESVAGGKTLNYVSTGGDFLYDTLQQLTVRVNFRTNLWSAALDDVPLFTDIPFYTGTAAVNLGAVGFRMFFGTVNGSAPNYSCIGGDNYLLFDDLLVQADPPEDVGFTALSKEPQNGAVMSWNTEAGYRYQVFASSDLNTWSLLTPEPLTASQSSGQSYTDSTAAGLPRRFYKVSRSSP
jgi:hypothetical protein